MHFSAFAVFGALASCAIAVPFQGTHVVHERRHAAPRGWVKREVVNARAMLPVRIGLTQRNLDKGHDLLMEVSQHDSPRFGKYYTAEEIHDLFAPSKVHVDAVRVWLESEGISSTRISQSVNKQWMQFDATTAELESLLRTKYYVYEHTGTGKENVACDEYHLPEQIREAVDYVTPGIKLFAGNKYGRGNIDKRTFGVTSGNPNSVQPPLMMPIPDALKPLLNQPQATGCGSIITPACIKTMYNITLGNKAAAGNTLGIFEDLADYYSQTDLNLFFANYYPTIPQGTHPTLKGVDGATAPVAVTAAGAESDLDFQIAYPVIYPQGTTLFQTDDSFYEANYNFQGFLNNFLDAIDGSYCTYSAFGETGNSPLDPSYPDPNSGGFKGALQCGVYKPTNVISISYGGQEFDLPSSYQQRQCNEYMKLGMQGVSIVVASGDSGVAGPAGDDNPNGCLGSSAKIFSPDFPASCPYITVLGATTLPTGASAAKDQERAVTRFPSGGGFSNIYAIPSYQQSAVSNYFTNHNPPYPFYSSVNNNSFGANGGIYNRLGRGYPDFGAVGDNVVIYNRGAATLIGGTSASAPVFAAILTRINEERLAVGKTTIGFVNPTLYAHPEVFHDITVGSNPGCGTNGFAVASGWDPVTGLGTPNYAKMLPLYMSLP